MIYTKQQNEALAAIRSFLESDENIFILKGYAGTGKTTIVKPIIDSAKAVGRNPYLATPTGRAAKILSEKTGYGATTIHSFIYGGPRMVMENGDETTESSVFYHFSLKEQTDYVPEMSLLIIDEASMVSSRKTVDEMMVFGSGILMDDLLAFAKLQEGAKIVFIGDPAQLPPVGDSRSCALDKTYFEEKGYKVSEYELTDVVRQESDSAILSNSITLRQCIKEEHPMSLSLESRDGEVEVVDYFRIPELFCSIAPVPDMMAPVVVCYTNKAAYSYNQMIRDKYYDGDSSVQVGDRLVISVNAKTQNRAVLNGEFAMVTEVSDKVESLQGVAYVNVAGEDKKQKVTVTLNFRDIRLLFDDGVEIPVKIHEDFLNGPARKLTYLQVCALISNFRMRHPDLKKGTKEYIDALSHDPYFNALCVKYGYAITCHKSQGGEWDTAFVDYSGRVGLNKDCLRWCYTASTRAKSRMYTTGLPFVPAFRAKVMPVKKVSKVPAEYYPEGADPIQAKLTQVSHALEGSGFEVSQVEHKPFREIYTISDKEGTSYRLDLLYNGSKIFTSVSDQSHTVPAEIIKMIADEPEVSFPFEYVPSQENMGELYSKIRSLCDENGIAVVNVVEHMENYRTVFYLRTDKGPAYIEAFVNKLGRVSYIVPCALCAEDGQLNNLTEGIKE